MRVLLLSDSPELAAKTESNLRRAEPRLELQATSADDAASALSSNGWTVVLLDCSTDNRDWRSVLAEVRRARPDVPFVVMAGEVTDAEESEAVTAGCAAYVPFGNWARLAVALDRQHRAVSVAPATDDSSVDSTATARRAERAEVAGTLATSMAETLMSLFTIVHANLQSLPMLDLVEREEAIAEAVAANSRAAESVRQLLRIARPRTPEPTRVFPVLPMLDRVAAIVRATSPSGVQVEVSAAHSLRVRGHAGELELAVLRLALRAKSAVRGFGTIRLTAEPMPAVGAAAAPDGRSLIRVSVSDDGPALSAVAAEHAFDDWSEVGDTPSLGLTTVAACARELGGWPEAVSEEGIGTRLSLIVPAARARAS